MLLEHPEQLAEAIRTAVQKSNVHADWLVQLLTRTHHTSTNLFFEDPEKFAKSITVLTQVAGVGLADAKLLLTSGSRTIISQLIQDPVILTNTI